MRLQRFTDLPHVLPALRTVDSALVGNHLDRALRLAEDLVADQPDIAEGWLFLGVTHQRAARSEDAITALRRAIELDAGLGEARLDLPYVEDAAADVDMNVVLTGDREIVEIQGSAEGRTFTREQHDALLDLAFSGCDQIFAIQRTALAEPLPA